MLAGGIKMPDTGKTDKLTGILNYEAFLEALDHQISGLDEEKGGFSLALIDIDMFKRVNDEHGSEIGDEVLKRVARHLVDSAPPRARVFRYAKDEFLVLMPGIEKEEAFLVLERARGGFAGEHELTAGKKKAGVSLSLSIGLAACPDDGTVGQEIVRKAGDALHRAKASGRNRVLLAREERMITKTSHYTQGQLERLSLLAKREGVGEAILLREALDDLLRKYTL
jgi:diguanylate cyclase (GGDEF)-like protein